jgi:hypothetical protein
MNNELKQEMTERFNSAYGEEVKIGLREALCKVYINGGEHGYQYALQHPQWIPVEEELPDEDMRVLTIDKDGYKEIMDFEFGKWSINHWPPITHWMPLPTPPRKKGGQDDNNH